MELVGRIDQRPEHHQQVAYRPRGVDQRARLGPAGDPELFEGVLDERQRRSGREEDGDVAEPGGPPSTRAVVHAPLLVDRLGHGGGHVGGLGRAQLVGRRVVRVFGSADDRHRWSGRGTRPDPVERDVVGLGRDGEVLVVRLADEAAECIVHPLDDRLAGAEVHRQRHGITIRSESVGGGQEHRDVGAPEPVDRLLRVAHEEQPARGDREVVPAGDPGFVPVGLSGGDPDGQFDLDGVGVLELVEEESLVTLVEPRSHPGPQLAVPQQAAGEDQQVVELELSMPPTLVGGIEGELPQGTAEIGRRRRWPLPTGWPGAVRPPPSPVAGAPSRSDGKDAWRPLCPSRNDGCCCCPPGRASRRSSSSADRRRPAA